MDIIFPKTGVYLNVPAIRYSRGGRALFLPPSADDDWGAAHKGYGLGIVTMITSVCGRLAAPHTVISRVGGGQQC